jgi:hypothetical protein
LGDDGERESIMMVLDYWFNIQMGVLELDIPDCHFGDGERRRRREVTS